VRAGFWGLIGQCLGLKCTVELFVYIHFKINGLGENKRCEQSTVSIDLRSKNRGFYVLCRDGVATIIFPLVREHI
jgi:hypothetical protein